MELPTTKANNDQLKAEVKVNDSELNGVAVITEGAQIASCKAQLNQLTELLTQLTSELDGYVHVDQLIGKTLSEGFPSLGELHCLDVQYVNIEHTVQSHQQLEKDVAALVAAYFNSVAVDEEFLALVGDRYEGFFKEIVVSVALHTGTCSLLQREAFAQLEMSSRVHYDLAIFVDSIVNGTAPLGNLDDVVKGDFTEEEQGLMNDQYRVMLALGELCRFSELRECSLDEVCEHYAAWGTHEASELRDVVGAVAIDTIEGLEALEDILLSYSECYDLQRARLADIKALIVQVEAECTKDEAKAVSAILEDDRAIMTDGGYGLPAIIAALGAHELPEDILGTYLAKKGVQDIQAIQGQLKAHSAEDESYETELSELIREHSHAVYLKYYRLFLYGVVEMPRHPVAHQGEVDFLRMGELMTLNK